MASSTSILHLLFCLLLYFPFQSLTPLQYSSSIFSIPIFFPSGSTLPFSYSVHCHHSFIHFSIPSFHIHLSLLSSVQSFFINTTTLASFFTSLPHFLFYLHILVCPVTRPFTRFTHSDYFLHIFTLWSLFMCLL